ncbi:hypothetical protein O181_020350 [Austropuccinia psidii MF-1]|uniref:Integrase catalytic domain-containing protein n=1 Tax=Austropuccinia psidii MF-1 TaxID=1389203 RepID=A0A9Q3CCE4_9BASI|nr:hypothetical protein [Austropuccinia psidii MF-1]
MNVNTISKFPFLSAKSWDECLCHVSNRTVKLFLQHFVAATKPEDWRDYFCEKCKISMNVKVGTSPLKKLRLPEPLDSLVLDVSGPFDKDPEGNCFLLTIQDHASTYTFTAALKSRANVPGKIIFWIEFLLNLLNKYPTRFKMDDAVEYSGKMEQDLSTFRTEWVPTKPYQEDHNWEAECANHTLGDMARKMLLASGLPAHFWSYAYSCTTHIHNRLTNKRIDPLIPMERLFNIQPDPSQLYPFDAQEIGQVPSEKRSTLVPREIERFLMTFLQSGKGWTFLNCASKKLFNSSSATFPDYQHLPVASMQKKGDVSFILNYMRLGKVPTEIHAAQEKSIASLPL